MSGQGRAAADRAPLPRRATAPEAARRGGDLLAAPALVGVAAAAISGGMPGLANADLHAVVGLLAGALAAAAHLRGGTGRDLAATLLLAIGVLLGMGVTGGLVGRGGHGAAALVAALVSMGVHGERLWRRLRR